MRSLVVLLMLTGEAMSQIMMSPAQSGNLITACFNHKPICRGPCNIPHPTSCFKYVVCTPTSGGSYYAQEMPCAFGTMWNAKAMACDLPVLSGCLKEPCSDPNMLRFPHVGNNCRSYWKCVNRISVPACCGKYKRFVATGKNGTCVNDITCDTTCPLVNDPDCSKPGIQALYLKDGNCKTHYACLNGQPHPACCKNLERYDVYLRACVPDPSCMQACPLDKTNGGCQNPAVKSFKMPGNNCRTYMDCDGLGGGVRRCCDIGHMYDETLGQCIGGNFPMHCESAKCPNGFERACLRQAHPHDPKLYKLLYFPTYMPCAVGTIFDKVVCDCVKDVAFFARAEAAAGVCKLDIDVKFPNLTNKGRAPAVIMMLGEYGHGEKGVGNMVAMWDGKTGVNIPYYGNRELSSLFLEIAFTPTGTSDYPQILLSSCTYDNLGAALLEIRLVSFHNKTGNLQLSIGDKLGSSLISANVAYEFNVQYIFRMIYDGKTMGIFLETANSILPTISDVRAFSGVIPIHVGGLRFATCVVGKGESSFIGTVSTIQFSECLTDIMKQSLYPAPLPLP